MVDGGQIVDAHLGGMRLPEQRQPAPNGPPATNGQPVPNGHPAAGHLLSDGHPFVNGRPVSKGHPVTGETPVTEGFPVVPRPRHAGRPPDRSGPVPPPRHRAPAANAGRSGRHRAFGHSGPRAHDGPEDVNDITVPLPITRRSPGRHRPPHGGSDDYRFSVDDLVARAITQAIPVARVRSRARSDSAPRPLQRDHA
jgi:hypothetical protein